MTGIITGAETGVEQGWSSGRDRQLWRFLARRLPGRRTPLNGSGLVATITFDDVPDNAVTHGAPVLERRGVRGTFYVAAATCGMQDRHWRVADRAQVRALSRAGHEIGCHTARHVNVQSLDAEGLTRECDRNRELLAEIDGIVPRNFCYPFGDVGLRQRSVLAERFTTCRTIYERPNAGRIDRAMLSAYGLFDAVIDRAGLDRLVREAKGWNGGSGGWLVFYTHDVSDDPTPIGTSPRLLDEALAVLAGHGVPVLTTDEAARHHGIPAEG